MNIQARKDRDAHIEAAARVAELEGIIRGLAAVAPFVPEIANYLEDRLDIAKGAAEHAARRTAANPVTCMFTIQRKTPAWDELEDAVGSALERVRLDPRENGVAIKVDNGTWSPTLVAFRQPARRP